MPQSDPVRLLLAAKTAIKLVDMVHEALWTLYPDELLELIQEPDKDLMDLLRDALSRQQQGPPEHHD